MRVNNCVAGASIPSRVCPHPFHQCRTNLFPKPASDCGVIKIRHCGVRWKIVGQISPFASVIYKIQHRVYQFPLFPFAPVSCSGKQRRHDRPLTVAQITRITASLIFLYHAPIIALPFLLVQLLIFFPADITWVLMHFPQLPLVFSCYLPLRHFCQKILNRP